MKKMKKPVGVRVIAIGYFLLSLLSSIKIVWGQQIEIIPATILGLILGIGLLKWKNWARIGVIINLGILLLGLWIVIIAIGHGLIIFLIGVPFVCIIYYLNRYDVKSAFQKK